MTGNPINESRKYRPFREVFPPLKPVREGPFVLDRSALRDYRPTVKQICDTLDRCFELFDGKGADDVLTYIAASLLRQGPTPDALAWAEEEVRRGA